MKIAVLLLLNFAAHAQPGVTSACPTGITSISACPLSGCGGVSDALLNQKKNRTTAPTAGIAPMKISDIKGIPQPKSWMTGKDRTSLTQEATPAVVMGVLKIAKEEHQETCNCELDGEASTDIHLVIVSKKSDV